MRMLLVRAFDSTSSTGICLLTSISPSLDAPEATLERRSCSLRRGISTCPLVRLVCRSPFPSPSFPSSFSFSFFSCFFFLLSSSSLLHPLQLYSAFILQPLSTSCLSFHLSILLSFAPVSPSWPLCQISCPPAFFKSHFL